MNRFRAWGLSAAVAAGAGAPALAADPPAARPQPTTLANKLFGPAKPKPDGPAARSPDPAAAMRPPVVTAPPPQDVQREAFKAEYDAYLRRLDVCTELRRVALERNDDALQRRVDELERQAADVYNQRVAALGVPRVKAPLPGPSGVAADPAPVTARAAADRLTAPAAPTPATGTTAAVRRVREDVVRTVDATAPTVSPPTPAPEGRP